MNPQADEWLKKLIIDFQKETVQEWESPIGKNHDMIQIAYNFTDTIRKHIDDEVRTARIEELKFLQTLYMIDDGLLFEDGEWRVCVKNRMTQLKKESEK